MCSRGDAFMVSFSIVIRIPGYGRVNLLLNPICECSCEDDAVSLVLNWPTSGLLMWWVLAQSARFMCLLLQRRAKQPRSDIKGRLLLPLHIGSAHHFFPNCTQI